MSETKHVAGWRRSSTELAYVEFASGGHYRTIVDAEGRPVAFVLGTDGEHWSDDPLCEDNTALIIAAPHLLAALKALQLQALQSPDLLKTEWGQQALEATRDAIALATGEQA